LIHKLHALRSPQPRCLLPPTDGDLTGLGWVEAGVGQRGPGGVGASVLVRVLARAAHGLIVLRGGTPPEVLPRRRLLILRLILLVERGEVHPG
jgi:hypothetical protein